MDLTIPGRKKLNKKLPWVTREVQKRRRAKIKAWNKLKAHRMMMKHNEAREDKRIKQLLTSYVEKRNKSAAANRVAISQYERRLAANIKQDSKSFFKYVASKSKRNVLVGPLLDDTGELVVDEIETEKILNNY